MKLALDPGQRFTCQQCGRCCRRGWDIALTPGEVDAYRRAGAERWFREGGASTAEGAAAEPFEAVPGHEGMFRIRKRADGACGFLSPDNRCRIHEEMGAARKPLTCRVFPFRFHPGEGPPLVTASFSCPTVLANEGALVSEQADELSALFREWNRAFPEEPGSVLFALQRPMPAATLLRMRRILREILDGAGSDDGGQRDLRESVARMGHLLDDWSRLRVLSLQDDAFTEYVELTGGFGVGNPKPPPRRRASRLSRLLFRGFVYAIVAARLQLEDGRRHGLRPGLRLRLARLLARAHGLWPGGADIDLGAARRARVDLSRPELRELAHQYLRASIETLGTGRRPVVEEAGIAVALLQAGCVLAAMRAGRAGRAEVDRGGLAQGLLDACDLAHADPGAAYGALLATLSGGVDACFLFAEGWPYRAAEV